MSVKIKIEFKKRDWWIGVYWERREPEYAGKLYRTPEVPELHIWICIIPLFPIHLTKKYFSWRIQQ